MDNWEMIVVDDGSEEDLTFVTSLDKRIRYIHKDRDNITGDGYGAPMARNIGKQNAKGRYILTFDSDDIALPNLLERESSFLESNPDCGAVYANRHCKGGKNCFFRACNNTKEDYEEMLRCQFIPNVGTMWRKDIMPDYNPDFGSGEDWDLMLTAMEQGIKFCMIKERLFIYCKGHPREENTKRQEDGCERVLAKRGYKFDRVTRTGTKI